MPYAIDPAFFSGAATGYVPEAGIGAGDYASAAYAGLQGMGAYGAAAQRYFIGVPDNDYEAGLLQAAQRVQEGVRRSQAATVEGMRPDAQTIFNATAFSPEFYSHPFAWVGMQGAASSPSIAAAVAAGAFTGGTALGGLAAAGAVSGGMSAADFLEAAQRGVDEKSDEQLQQDSDLYKEMRQGGMPEQMARAHFSEEITRNAVPLLFAAGAALGAAGTPGQMLRAFGPAAVRQAIARQAPRGLAKRVGEEAAVGFGTETGQTTLESLVGQQAAVNAGYQPDVDVAEALKTGIGAGLVGGAFGVAAGLRRDYQPPAPVTPSPPGASAGAGAGGGFIGPPGPPSGYPGFIGPPPPPPGSPAFIGPMPAPPGSPWFVGPPGPPPGYPGFIGPPGPPPGSPGFIGPMPHPLGPAGGPYPSGVYPSATPSGGALPLTGGAVRTGPAPGSPGFVGPLPGVSVTQPTAPDPAAAAALAGQTSFELTGMEPSQQRQMALPLNVPVHQPVLPFGPEEIPPGQTIAEAPEQPELPLVQTQPAQRELPLPEPPPEPNRYANLGPAPMEPVTPAEGPISQSILEQARRTDPETLRQILRASEGTQPGDPSYLSPIDAEALRQVVGEYDQSLQGRLINFLIQKAGISEDDYAEMHGAASAMDDDQLRTVMAQRINTANPLSMLRLAASARELQRRLGREEPKPAPEFTPEEQEQMSRVNQPGLRAQALQEDLAQRLADEGWQNVHAGLLTEEEALRVKRAIWDGLDRQVQHNLEQLQGIEWAPDYTGERLTPEPQAEIGTETPSKFLKKGKAWIDARAAEDERTAQLFQQFAAEPPKKATGRTAAENRRSTAINVREWLGDIMTAAKAAKITIRGRIGYEQTSPETFWLAKAARIHKLLQLGDPSKPSKEQIDEAENFLTQHYEAAATGDFEPFKKERQEYAEARAALSADTSKATDEEGVEQKELPPQIVQEGGEARALSMFEGAPTDTKGVREPTEEELGASEVRGTVTPTQHEVPTKGKRVKQPGEIHVTKLGAGPPIPSETPLGKQSASKGERLGKAEFGPYKTKQRAGLQEAWGMLADVVRNGSLYASPARGPLAEATEAVKAVLDRVSFEEKATRGDQPVLTHKLLREQGESPLPDLVEGARKALSALQRKLPTTERGAKRTARRMQKERAEDAVAAAEDKERGARKRQKEAEAKAEPEQVSRDLLDAQKRINTAVGLFETFAKSEKLGKGSPAAVKAKARRLKAKLKEKTEAGIAAAKEGIGKVAPYLQGEAGLRGLRGVIPHGETTKTPQEMHHVRLAQRGGRRALLEKRELNKFEQAQQAGAEAFRAGAPREAPSKYKRLKRLRTNWERGWDAAELETRLQPPKAEPAQAPMPLGPFRTPNPKYISGLGRGKWVRRKVERVAEVLLSKEDVRPKIAAALKPTVLSQTGTLTGGGRVETQLIRRKGTRFRGEATPGRAYVGVAPGEGPARGERYLQRRFEREGARLRGKPKVGAETYAWYWVPAEKTEGPAAVKAAERRIVTPTPKQRAAGNYRKGHLRIFGLDISLEVPRLGMRVAKAVDDQGQPLWKSRMYHPYGAIRGTVSTDGENVDVYLGPKAYPGSLKLREGPPTAKGELPITQLLEDRSLPVYVIEQHNVDGPQAGAFDEHKVMLGFESWEKAKAAYVKSFSDGKGEQRIGGYKPMYLDEFKRWVNDKNRTTRPLSAEPRDPLLKHLKHGTGLPIWEKPGKLMPRSSFSISPEEWAKMSPEEREALAAIGVPQLHGEADPAAFFGVKPVPLSQHLNTQYLNGLVNVLPPHLRGSMRRIIDRVATLSANVPTYVVTDDAFQTAFGRLAGGVYRAGLDYIALRKANLGRPELTMHEATHAALQRALHADPALQAEAETLLADMRKEALRTGQDHYAFINADEMMASFFDDPAYRHFLMAQTKPELNIWQRAWRWFANLLGLRKPQDATLLERLVGLMDRTQEQGTTERGVRASDALMESMAASRKRVGSSAYFKQLQQKVQGAALERELRGTSFGPSDWLRESMEELRNRAPDWASDRLGGPDRSESSGIPWLLKLRNLDEIVQVARDFGTAFYNAARRFADAGEMQRVTADQEARRYQPILDEFYQLQQRYKSSPAQQRVWEDFVDLLHTESQYEVNAELPLTQAAQPHLFTSAGNPTLHSAQGRAKWADLNRRYQRLPHELMVARQHALDLYKELQTRRRDQLGINRMAKLLAGKPVMRDMLDRILDGTETPADVAYVGGDENVDSIRDAARMTSMRGPYYPFIRRGDFVVNARYKVPRPPPGTATIVTGTTNRYEFHNERDAIAYAASLDQKAVPVKRTDALGHDAYFVTVQDQHTEFFDSRNAARERAAAMESMPEFASVSGVEPVRLQYEGLAASLNHRELDRMFDRLDKSATFQALSSTEKRLVKQALTHAAMQSLAQTRVSASRMPRAYVPGWSNDFVRNMWDYTQSASSDYAKLKHQPMRDEALREMNDLVDTTDKKGSAARRAMLNEFERRTRISDRAGTSTKFDSAVQRVAQLAFSVFLGSPAHTLVNLMQVPMVAVPHLTGVYGTPASPAVTKAYGDITAVKLLGAGLKATWKRLQAQTGAEDFVGQMIANGNLSANEKRMLRRLREVGSLGGETGMELGRMIRNPGKLDRALSYLTELSRQMPRAAEAVNRGATALATYRLELERNGGDHEAATLKAQEVTNLTHGLYSATDAAPIFNSTFGQLALIFKKFGALMYGYMGHQIGRAIRNAEPGARKEALLSLGYMLGATTLMAGSLGLPNDPFKALLLGLNAAGVTDLTWSDVEFFQREVATNVLGGFGGELATRGLARLLGVDVSGRLGLNDMFLHGEPATMDSQGLGSYLWDMTSGAPASMVVGNNGIIAGIRHIHDGDYLQAAESFSPIKVLSNAIKGYRRATEGEFTRAGYQELEPTGMVDGLLQTIGFAPRHAAEVSEARRQYFRQAKRMQENRNDLLHAYVKAGAAGKAKVWVNQIVPWNRGQPRDQQITRADLNTYEKRRKSEDTLRGIRLTRTNRPLVQRVQEAIPSL